MLRVDGVHVHNLAHLARLLLLNGDNTNAATDASASEPRFVRLDLECVFFLFFFSVLVCLLLLRR